MDVVYDSSEAIAVSEYIAFLRTTDLGSMYPKKDFEARISSLLQHADIVVTARDAGTLVGVCLGITDHTYFMFITDLGVSRGHERCGIGRTLVKRAVDAAGGFADITVATWSNRKALPFYEELGIRAQTGLVAREGTDWEPFDVRDLPDAPESI